MSDENARPGDAEALAGQAAEVASRLKVGTWESVRALALMSIAQSLIALRHEQEAARSSARG